MLFILAIYLLIGVVFSFAFVLVGCRVIDPSAQGAGLIVRAFWMPAAIALWPLLTIKWIKSAKTMVK